VGRVPADDDMTYPVVGTASGCPNVGPGVLGDPGKEQVIGDGRFPFRSTALSQRCRLNL
jgi:hypothetical protein